MLATKESEKDAAEQNEIDDEPVEKFSKTEVNGKFKIMQPWDERLKDPESEEFKSYSETITRGIEEMLAQDEISLVVEEGVAVIDYMRATPPGSTLRTLIGKQTLF